jgi:LytS/YehU family sensor histidine kinase
LRRAITQEGKYLEDFTVTGNDQLEIETKSYLELVFKDALLNEDSSIQYRLSTSADKGDWKQTGHFMLLRNLKSNTQYTLEVKYANGDTVNQYSIISEAKWYQKPRSFIWMVVLAFVAALFIGFVSIRMKLNRERKKKEQVQNKLKTIQSQLNPHFIFNALSSIQSLVNNDQKEAANEYLTHFSMVLRGALSNGELSFVSLSSELEFLKNYIEIEKLRFNFSYHISVDINNIEPNNIEVPPMLLQPAIENAILHGISGKGSEGSISIDITTAPNGFVIQISDNGLWDDTPPNNGYGIPLTLQRIAAINEIGEGRKIEHGIRKTKDGTIVSFNFINWFV